MAHGFRKISVPPGAKGMATGLFPSVVLRGQAKRLLTLWLTRTQSLPW